MDGDICPPWWPNLLWWFIHHPPKGNGPMWDEQRIRIVDEALAGLATFVMAGSLGESAANKVRSAAGEDLRATIAKLTSER